MIDTPHVAPPQRYVILVRNPSNNKIIGIQASESEYDDSLASFSTFDEARAAANHIPVCQAWPFDIVEAP